MVFAHITDFKAKRSVSTPEYNDPTAVVPRYLGKMPQTLFPPHTASFVAAAQLHAQHSCTVAAQLHAETKSKSRAAQLHSCTVACRDKK